MAQLKGKYIEDAAVTLAKQASITTASIMGRKTAGTGVQEVLSKTDVLTLLNVADGATANVGDMVLNTVQAVTAEKKFTKDKLTLLGTSTGKIILSNANESATDYTVILQAKAGTLALTSDIVSGGTFKTEILTLAAGDITAKYKDLTETPITATAVTVCPVGGIPQEYTVDFTVITNGSVVKRLNWSGLGLEALLEATDKIIVSYTY